MRIRKDLRFRKNLTSKARSAASTLRTITYQNSVYCRYALYWEAVTSVISSGKTEEGAYVLEEFNFDSFERRFRLSDSISREKISARYENGMLYLTFVDVPAEEEREAQTVEVQ
mgnify:CR=1 FL=1